MLYRDFCVYFIVVFISLPYCQKDVGRINLYDNGLCVYLLFGVFSSPFSLKKERGEESLQTLVITSSDSDGYFRFILIGLYLACLLYNNHR